MSKLCPDPALLTVLTFVAELEISNLRILHTVLRFESLSLRQISEPDRAQRAARKEAGHTARRAEFCYCMPLIAASTAETFTPISMPSVAAL